MAILAQIVRQAIGAGDEVPVRRVARLLDDAMRQCDSFWEIQFAVRMFFIDAAELRASVNGQRAFESMPERVREALLEQDRLEQRAAVHMALQPIAPDQLSRRLTGDQVSGRGTQSGTLPMVRAGQQSREAFDPRGRSGP